MQMRELPSTALSPYVTGSAVLLRLLNSKRNRLKLQALQWRVSFENNVC